MTTNQSADPALDNLRRIREEVRETLAKCGRSEKELRIMAVTKTVEPERINQVIDAGIDLLGENRVQEFLSKEEAYHLERAQVHFIGHLQSNKVKYIIDKVTMIESVSSLKLAREIDRCAAKAGRTMDVLLEVNIGEEESKSGFAKEELWNALPELAQLPHLHVKGLMCIPPVMQSEKFFCDTRQLFIDIKDKKLDNIDMSILSMGMSADYKTAIEYGSNIIRLGTALFGRRNYNI